MAKASDRNNTGGVGGYTPPGAAPVPVGTQTSGLEPIGFSEGMGADERNAELLRQQYRDWEQRFKPLQDQYFAYADPTSEQAVALLNEQLGRIHVNGQHAMQSAQMAADVTRGHYGIQQSGTQQLAHDRDLGLSSALSQAQARNATRQHFVDRADQMMLGAIMPPSQGGI